MNALIPILTVLIVAAVVALVSAPLRAHWASGVASDPQPADAAAAAGLDADLQRQELEAAREAKYREIRDAELDYRTGKLSRADFEATDSQLRTEALAILNRLEVLTPGPAEPVEGLREQQPSGDEPARTRGA